MPGVRALPVEPAPEEITAYIQQIAEVTAEQPHDPRRDDPQAELLGVLADEHLDELFQAHEAYPQLRYYLDPIIHREIARRGGPDVERLEAVRLRKNADDRAAWSYIIDIARATAGQRRVSSTDPQVAMLALLADGNMPALIDAVELDELRFYALLAIRTGVTAEHKDTIIAALVRQPRLIGVVRQEGWASDAQPQLIAGLEQGIVQMPRTWVQVVAELRDPETYDALSMHLARTRCSRTYYSMMHNLPGFDPGPAVSAAWQQVYFQPTHARELREIAELAIGFGQAEALSHLIDLLPSEGSLDPANDELLRKIVLRHIAFTGSNAEIKAWHHDHQNRLRFSNEDRCFYVSGLLQ